MKVAVVSLNIIFKIIPKEISSDCEHRRHKQQLVESMQILCAGIYRYVHGFAVCVQILVCSKVRSAFDMLSGRINVKVVVLVCIKVKTYSSAVNIMLQLLTERSAMRSEIQRIAASAELVYMVIFDC